jgi:hypothetical protein
VLLLLEQAMQGTYAVISAYVTAKADTNDAQRFSAADKYTRASRCLTSGNRKHSSVGAINAPPLPFFANAGAVH